MAPSLTFIHPHPISHTISTFNSNTALTSSKLP